VIPSGQTVLAGTEPTAPIGTDDSQNHGTPLGLTGAESAPFTITPGATTGGQTVNNAAGSTSNPTLDFGFNSPLASLGDRVWFDNNANGIQDPNEPGVPQVAVELLDSNGTVVKSTTTDANGNYKFTDLQAGTYSVRFAPSTLPSGATFTTPNQGSNDATNSKADTATGTTATFTLGKREYKPTLDAGIVPPAPILPAVPTPLVFAPAAPVTAPSTIIVSGPAIPVTSPVPTVPPTTVAAVATPSTPSTTAAATAVATAPTTTAPAKPQTGRIAADVWVDNNDNGKIDLGEQVVAGAQLIITGPNGFKKITETDANGHYDVSGLEAGDYTVEITGVGIDPALKYLTGKKINIHILGTELSTAQFRLEPNAEGLALTGNGLTLLWAGLASLLSGLAIATGIHGRKAAKR
jgi:hypothetical protein